MKKKGERSLSLLENENRRLKLEIEEKLAQRVKPTEVNVQSNVSLLEEFLAASPEDSFRLVTLDRTSESSFKMVVEGSFLNVMKLVGTLERDGGRYSLSAAELMRLEGKSDHEPQEEIRATLTVAGGGT